MIPNYLHSFQLVLAAFILLLSNASAAGQKAAPPAVFVVPSLSDAVAAYHYATPYDHLDTLRHIGVRFHNKENYAVGNVGLKARIQKPDGTEVTLQRTLSYLPAGADTFVYFPPYLPPAIPGIFTVHFTNSFYSGPAHTLLRTFMYTERVFASDNMVPFSEAIPPFIIDIFSASFFEQDAALYFTGPIEDKATYIVFGLSNVDSVYVPEPGANTIGVVLYDADANDDGLIDLIDNFQDLEILSLTTYDFDGTEAVDSLISVELQDLSGNPYVELEANHPYYASLFYNGEIAAHGWPVIFTRSTKEQYVDFPTTPRLYNDFIREGWPEATLFSRLVLESFAPVQGRSSAGLDPGKCRVSPQPASDRIRVNIQLDAYNEAVSVVLHDALGRSLRRQKLVNFQMGELEIDCRDLPFGTYILGVYSGEGSLLRKVMVGR